MQWQNMVWYFYGWTLSDKLFSENFSKRLLTLSCFIDLNWINRETFYTAIYFKHQLFDHPDAIALDWILFFDVLTGNAIYEVGIFWSFKGALSDLRQYLANETPLKMMKNAFYFTLKALFVFKIFKFLSWLFRHVEKRLDYDLKDKVNFKIYDITTWETNNCNIHIALYLR